MAVIYEIRIGEYYYIGSTNDAAVRRSNHISQLRSQTHGNSFMQRVFNKYGEANFEFIVLEEVPDHEQFKAEQLYLDKYFALNDGKFMNAASFATGGGAHKAVLTDLCTPSGELLKNVNLPQYARNHGIDNPESFSCSIRRGKAYYGYSQPTGGKCHPKVKSKRVWKNHVHRIITPQKEIVEVLDQDLMDFIQSREGTLKSNQITAFKRVIRQSGTNVKSYKGYRPA